MGFDLIYSPSPNSSQIQHTSLPTQSCLFPPHQGQFVLLKYSWMDGFPLECGQLIMGYSLEKQPFIS